MSDDVNKTSFDNKCVIKLGNIIRSKKKIYRKVNKKQWIRQFEKFRFDSQIKKQRLKNVLTWYSHHIGEEFVPAAYSAKTFCDKFLRIEDAMNRWNEKFEKGEIDMIYTKVKTKKLPGGRTRTRIQYF